MEVNQSSQLSPGTPVWVWVVRVGKGRWWPGTVLSIASLEPFPIVNTRFECRAVGRNGIDGPAFVGISTTRMRYLEARDPELKGDDRPTFIPSAIFAKPEEPKGGFNELQAPNSKSADIQAVRVSAATPVKKLRSRKKTKASGSTRDATSAAIES